MINYTLMFVQRKDDGNVYEAFNDYQEKLGNIKKIAHEGTRVFEATIFDKKLSRQFSSLEQAKRFIESNY